MTTWRRRARAGQRGHAGRCRRFRTAWAGWSGRSQHLAPRQPLMSARRKIRSATASPATTSAASPAKPAARPGGAPVPRNRDQKLAGRAVTEPSPAGKPIQLATQVAGVQGPAPGSAATASIAMIAPAVAAIVPMAPRVITAASSPMTANAASTSSALATWEPDRPSPWATVWSGPGRWLTRASTGPATASAAQQAAMRPTPASHRLTSLATSTCQRRPCWVSRLFMVRPDHSPPTWAPASSAIARAPGREAISPAASAPAAAGASWPATWAGSAWICRNRARAAACQREHCGPAGTPSAAQEGRCRGAPWVSSTALWLPPAASSRQNSAAAAATPRLSGLASLASSACSSRIVHRRGVLGHGQERLLQGGPVQDDLVRPDPALAERPGHGLAVGLVHQHRVRAIRPRRPGREQRQGGPLVGGVKHRAHPRPGRGEPGHRALLHQPAGPQHRDLVADLLDLGEQVTGQEHGDAPA